MWDESRVGGILWGESSGRNTVWEEYQWNPLFPFLAHVVGSNPTRPYHNPFLKLYLTLHQFDFLMILIFYILPGSVPDPKYYIITIISYYTFI